MVEVIAGVSVRRAQRPETGRLIRIALVGFVSGMVIPYLFLLVLDVSLLTLGLWGVWMDTSKLSAPQGQSTAGAFFLALASSLATVLKHFWGFRWVGIAVGGVGGLAAVVGYYAARAGREAKGATFLTILALSAFVVNATALIFQERRSALAAAERLVFIYYQIAESHWAVLVLGTTVAFLLAALVWEPWRTIYKRVASWWGLRLPSPTGPISRENLRSAGHSSQSATEEWHVYQDRIGRLKREAAESHSSLSGFRGGSGAKLSPQAQWWPFVLSLLVGVLLLTLLERAYLRAAPAVTSEVVYLKPDQPTSLVRLTIGSEPKSITFSSSTGQGLVDFRLEDVEGRVLREIKGFQLRDLPGIAYNTATMPAADLSPGTYILRVTLCPTEEGTARESVLGKSSGLVSWSLLRGGGPWFRVLAVLMAGLTTLILINACILLAGGSSWFRDRYF